MNKILRYSFVALLAMVFGNVLADEVTIAANSSAVLESGEDYVATQDGVTLTYSKGTSTTAISGGIKEDQIRIYKNALLTVSSTETISKIVVTAVINNKIGADGFVADDYEAADDKLTGTWTGSSNSIVLTASGGQVRITQVVVTIGGSASTKTATKITFEDGYKTQIGQGPDDMFPEVGETVALPTATVMAGDAAVAGANVEWSLQVTSWKAKEGKPEPSISDGKISVADGYGVLEVKASYAGNDTYEASNKKYTLTVYNSYGLLKEMANDIADPDCTKDDESDGAGKPVFYFFRNIDGAGFPVATSTVTYANGKYIYLTDGEGANLLFYGTNSQNLKQGDVISGNVSETNLGGFWGTLKRYNKLPEFAFTDMNVKVESEGAAVAPTTITVDQLKDYINAYVKVENAEFVSADGKNLTFKVGETELALYNQFGLEVSDLEATAKYTIEGMGCVYKKNKETAAVYQIYPINFTETAGAGINEMKANVQFEGKTYNVAGQVVNKGYKGLVIVNGQKFVQK